MASNYFVINYNKAIFSNLGIAVPKTFAEFAAACTTIKAAGITPIYEPIADGWHHVALVPDGRALVSRKPSPGSPTSSTRTRRHSPATPT